MYLYTYFITFSNHIIIIVFYINNKLWTIKIVFAVYFYLIIMASLFSPFTNQNNPFLIRPNTTTPSIFNHFPLLKHDQMNNFINTFHNTDKYTETCDTHKVGENNPFLPKKENACYNPFASILNDGPLSISKIP